MGQPNLGRCATARCKIYVMNTVFVHSKTKMQQSSLDAHVKIGVCDPKKG